ncbi:MAG: phage virion morphogenesis protein [Prevotella sp.]|nr:phage virion morphogenesis protein [Prevotella sp.]
MTGEDIKRRILSDMKVELADEFDQNFRRKAFFTEAWKARRDPTANGSLLLVTGTLRRSIQSSITPKGVRFTSNVPYASMHNEGLKGSVTVKGHWRKGKTGKQHKVKQHSRKVDMPKRQFVGDGPRTQSIIKGVIHDTLKEFEEELKKQLKQ